MRLMAVAVAFALLASCAPTPKPVPPPPVAAPPAPRPATPAPVAAVTPPAPDQCRSAEFRYLVGRLRSEIPIPADPSRRRVACTTCPVTMDYSPERLNILFDAETGIIKEVKCG